jgi:type 1 glutamine amidotransferase
MKKILKIVFLSISVVILLATIGLGIFIYKVKYGFPVRFETEIPDLTFPKGKTTVLLFSKTSGFRHDESIEEGKKTFTKLAAEKDWFLYETEKGGVFNSEQLAKFDVVIFNNSTGRVLNDAQQLALEQYVEQGGTLLGIHGAGDDSHRWPWYEQHLIGARFSHHPIKNQIQEADVILEEDTDPVLSKDLPLTWAHSDEWYIFFSNPKIRGFRILYTIDGDKIDPNGNLFLIKNKDFGMGKDHPVAWYRKVGNGRTFYTSMGHTANTWKQQPFLDMLVNVIDWGSPKK